MAEPEADPAYLYHGLPLIYNNAIVPANLAPFNPLLYKYHVPIAPKSLFATPTPAVATPPIPAARPYTPFDCVTAEGCAVRKFSNCLIIGT